MTKSPFPGMDPFLEPFWGDVHASLIVYMRSITPELSSAAQIWTDALMLQRSRQ
ncbi:MAG: DUF4058 family protein [Planctomycetaceae bacterium]